MRGILVAAWLIAACFPANGQPPGEHEGHHPPDSAAAKPAASGGEMGGMMGGAAAPKEFYPELMALPQASREGRERARQLARERVRSGRDLLDAAFTQLADAEAAGDAARAREAAARIREGLAVMQGGVAAERALAEGAAPRDVALSWFRQQMAIAEALEPAQRHGFFGLSSFHYVTMAAVAAFAIMLGFTTIGRRRRTSALIARLAAPAPTATSAAAPPVPSVAGGWSGALRIARIFEETADVKTFRLAPTAGEGLPFTFEPGQFLTVSATVGGKVLKRSYSIASSPCCHGWCEITVKKVRGGMSEYLHERLREGDVVDASGPYGRFTFRGREAPGVVLIAGGVGITPLMSSIRYLTDQSWNGEIFLIYAAPRREAIIFREEIERLAARHRNLKVTIVLSDEPSNEWTGARGFVTAELLQAVVPQLVTRRVHLCGPPPMMKAVGAELIQAGVPPAQLKTELFLSPEAPKAPVAATAAVAATCFFTRSGKHAPLAPGQTVLDAAESAGVAIEYSCRQGFCGVCRVKLLKGEVTMEVSDGLASADRDTGWILACQAHANADLSVEA